MLDKLSLDFDSVKKHGSESNYNHFLIDNVDLSQRLKNSRQNLLLDDFLLAFFLNRKERNSCHNVTEDFFFFLVVKQIKQDFEESFPAEVAKDFWVFSQVAHQLDHETDQFVALVFVDRVLETVLDCWDLGLVDEVNVKLGLARHVAESDASALDKINLMLLRRVKQVDQRLDLWLFSLTDLHILNSTKRLRLRFHEVLVGTQVSQRDGGVFDCVFVQLSVDSLQQESADVLLDELVSEVFVETQVGEVATSLSVLVQVLGVLQHHYHEVDGIWRGDFRVAVQNFRDMSQARCWVKHRLAVFRLLTKFDDGLNYVSLDAMAFYSVRILGFI